MKRILSEYRLDFSHKLDDIDFGNPYIIPSHQRYTNGEIKKVYIKQKIQKETHLIFKRAIIRYIVSTIFIVSTLLLMELF